MDVKGEIRLEEVLTLNRIIEGLWRHKLIYDYYIENENEIYLEIEKENSHLKLKKEEVKKSCEEMQKLFKEMLEIIKKIIGEYKKKGINLEVKIQFENGSPLVFLDIPKEYIGIIKKQVKKKEKEESIVRELEELILL